MGKLCGTNLDYHRISFMQIKEVVSMEYYVIIKRMLSNYILL